MNRFQLLYEIGDDAKDGGELAELFINRYLEDTHGLDHKLRSIDHDIEAFSVVATIDTRARVSEEWFENANEVIFV